MDYDEIRKTIENITRENYGDFIKAVVSFEIYDEYMKNDNFNLLNDNFDNLLNGLTEPEEYKENEKCEKKKFSTDEFLHGVKSHSDNIHSISKDSEIEI